MDPSAPCPIPLEQSIAALRLECGALEVIVGQLRPEDLARTTRFEWSVQLLLAHLVRGLHRLHAALTAPQPPQAQTTWLDYWDGERASDSAAARARTFAKSINDRPVLGVWTQTWQRAVTEAAATDPARVLISPVGGIRLDHFATTRVFEVTVHGLDLRHALGLEEVATPVGLEVTTALLEALLGRPRPDDLTDNVDFVLAATGRAEHDDPHLPILR